MSSLDAFPTFRRIGRAVGLVMIGATMTTGRGLRWCARRALKPLLAVWKPLLAVLIVLTVVHSVATLVLGRRVEAEIEKLRAAGEPVSPAQRGGVRVPDAENGAVIYNKAFRVMRRLQRDRDAKIGSEVGHEEYLGVLDPEELARNPGAWDAARKAVTRFAPVYELAEQAASMPRCRFKADWEDGYAALFPYLAPLRSLVRLLAVRAVVSAKDGDMATATDSLRLMLRACNSIEHDPTLIHQGVRVALAKMMSSAMRQVAQFGTPTVGQARSFYSELGNVDFRVGLANAMRGDRALGLSSYDRLRRDGYDVIFLGNSLPWRTWLSATYAGRPLLYLDELGYLRSMDEMIRFAAEPYPQGAKHFLEIEQRDGGAPSSVRDILLPCLSGAYQCSQEGAAQVAGSRVFLALHAYRRQHGSYPSDLASLRRKLGWTLEKDPFTGKDFLYRLAGDGFVLYSVGRNLKDDGGVVAGEKQDQDKFGDIVWRLDR